MATLLDLVNDVRGQLSRERVGSLPAAGDFDTDSESTEIIANVNAGLREILEDHRWPFRARYDGKIYWAGPASFHTGAKLTFVDLDNNATNIQISPAMGIAPFAAFNFTSQAHRPAWQLQVESDNVGSSTTPGMFETIYRVADFDGTNGTLVNPWGGRPYTVVGGNEGTGDIFATEYVLGDKHRVITSVRHQERPLKLVGADKDQRFDARFPRPGITFSEQPSIYYVIDGLEPSGNSDGAGVGNPGPALGVWPIPDQPLTIDYSYEVRGTAALSLATDTVAGVPDQVLDLVVFKAYAMTLRSDVQNDPIRASQVERYVEKRLPRVKRSQRKDRNRGMPLRAFGKRGARSSSTRLWDSQIVSSDP